MDVPTYVWISTITLLFVKEVRHWLEMMLTHADDPSGQSEAHDDDNEPEMPDSVKHMYS